MRKALLILLVTGFLLPIELNGQLRFNEIIALNSTGQINPLTGEVSDWIEIYNSGTEEINISHYFLSVTSVIISSRTDPGLPLCGASHKTPSSRQTTS